MKKCFCGADAMLPCPRCDHSLCPQHGPQTIDEMCGPCEEALERRRATQRRLSRAHAVGVALWIGAGVVAIAGIAVAVWLRAKVLGYIIAPLVGSFIAARPVMMRRADRAAFLAERPEESGGAPSGGDRWT